jgi:hypothetical protein
LIFRGNRNKFLNSLFGEKRELYIRFGKLRLALVSLQTDIDPGLIARNITKQLETTSYTEFLEFTEKKLISFTKRVQYSFPTIKKICTISLAEIISKAIREANLLDINIRFRLDEYGILDFSEDKIFLVEDKIKKVICNHQAFSMRDGCDLHNFKSELTKHRIIIQDPHLIKMLAEVINGLPARMGAHPTWFIVKLCEDKGIWFHDPNMYEQYNNVGNKILVNS